MSGETCSTCSAIVADMAAHLAWHKSEKRAVQRAAIPACKRCNGTGRQPGLFNRCGRCDGSGKER